MALLGSKTLPYGTRRAQLEAPPEPAAPPLSPRPGIVISQLVRLETNGVSSASEVSLEARGSVATRLATGGAATQSARVVERTGSTLGWERPRAAAPQQVAAPPGPFRPEALRARFEELEPPPLPELTGSRWAALGLLGSIVLVLAAVACFGRVEVTSEALGSLRVQGGPRPVVAQASGVVGSLSVKAGDSVQKDDEVARIEAKELSARVERTLRELELLREGVKADRATEELEERTLKALEQARGLLLQRATLKEQQLATRRASSARARSLVKEGVASETEVLVADEAVSAGKEELLLLRQQIAEVGVQIAERQRLFGTERIERELQVREAEVGLAEAETLAVLSQVRAPESGRVESLLVSEGEVVQAGSVLARIIPGGTASSAVVFAPAKDAAFLRSGLRANLEFPSLPIGEFGRARATVTRVGNDLALPAEIAAVMPLDTSPPGGLVRVEVSVVEDEVWKKMAPRLHSGAQVIARLETRQRRIITLLLDVLR